MLFVIVREIEASRLDQAVFASVREAQEVYAKAAYVCDNGPDDDPGDDPTIVTNCWLYSVDTTDQGIALAWVTDGKATLMMAYA